MFLSLYVTVIMIAVLFITQYSLLGLIAILFIRTVTMIAVFTKCPIFESL